MRKHLSFTVYGNQNDQQGNPIGYTRTTQKSKWNKQSIRYEKWKQYVWFSLLGHQQERYRYQGKTVVECTIWFANKKHADSGNVVKGIADALSDSKQYGERLYKNDNKVLERVKDFFYDKAEPRVFVDIYESE